MINFESINKSCDFPLLALHDPGLFLFEARADVTNLGELYFY